tara:strand:- start:668 stop:1210 length:543 start_codon:yes stop_codon:yes gene_type:complete
MPIQRAKPRIIDLDQTPLTSISSADMPAGTVIAAEYARKQDHQTFTSTSFADVTGLTVTMTPASTSSKFLVTASVHISTYNWAAGGMYFGVFANSTRIAGSGSQVWMVDYGPDASNAQYENRQYFAQRLYSPSSTSSQLFKVQLANGSSSYNGYVNRNYISSTGQGSDGECYLSVLEIAG